MDQHHFANTSSPETVDNLNDERLRRSEESARGWHRNILVLLAVVVAAFGYWALK